MKKIVKFAASLLVFAGALVSCQKETLRQELDSVVPTSFTASFEQTKLTIDGFSPKFEVGDELTVEGSNSAKATFVASEVSASGSASFKIKGSWSATPSAPYKVYSGTPSMSNAAMLAYSAPNTISNAKSMSLNQSIVLGQANDLTSVEMKNMCSVIKIVVPEDVKAIKVAPSSGTLWDGAAIMLQTLTLSQFPSAYAKEITYTGNGETLVAGTYYIPFFPQTFTGGVMVGYTIDGTEYFWKEKSGNFIFQRNKLYDMGSLANWPKPEPKFAVEDLVGTFIGNMQIGTWNGASMMGNLQTEAVNVIEASDNTAKGNVKFTTFENMSNAFYAQFDLYTGTVTFTMGETVNYDAGSVTVSKDFALALSEDKETLSLAANTAIGLHPALGPMMGWTINAEPFTLTKQAPAPTGPTVDDFAGTYSGGLSETMKMAGMTYGTQDRSGITQDFVFEAAVNGDNNILMTKFYGNACSVQGVFDPATLTATFSAGTIPGIQGTGSLTSPLVLVLSNDYTSLTQVGVAIIQPTGVPFTLEETLTTLTKQNVGPVAGFKLEDVYDYGWAVTYKANGEAKAETSGSNTTFQKQTDAAAATTGCNLFINYFMCGYNSGYANFDIATGILTIPQANNAGVLYFPAIDWVGRFLNSDIVMQMSEDKKTIVATGAFQLKDGTTISEYTLTRQ